VQATLHDAPEHVTPPLHALIPVQHAAVVGALLTTPAPHESMPVHDTSHEPLPVHWTPALHEPEPALVTEHWLAPHTTLDPQELSLAQFTVQLLALAQSTPELHPLMPHVTWQGNPVGQTTRVAQAPAPEQSNAHTPASVHWPPAHVAAQPLRASGAASAGASALTASDGASWTAESPASLIPSGAPSEALDASDASREAPSGSASRVASREAASGSASAVASRLASTMPTVESLASSEASGAPSDGPGASEASAPVAASSGPSIADSWGVPSGVAEPSPTPPSSSSPSAVASSVRLPEVDEPPQPVPAMSTSVIPATTRRERIPDLPRDSVS
jgi:hypothetical protein